MESNAASIGHENKGVHPQFDDAPASRQPDGRAGFIHGVFCTGYAEDRGELHGLGLDEVEALAAADPDLPGICEMYRIDQGTKLWILADDAFVKQVSLLVHYGEAIVVEAPHVSVPRIGAEEHPVLERGAGKPEPLFPMAHVVQGAIR